MTMVFEDGFFHADPHPGNLFVEPDGRLGLVDFGMVGSIDAPTRSRLIRVFIATAAGDAPTLTDELLGLGVHTAPRSEEHTSELQSLMRISYAVFCLKKKKTH